MSLRANRHAVEVAMLVDTHCHIHNPDDYELSTEQLLSETRSLGVEKMITIGVNPADSRRAQAFAAKHSEVFWTFGYHPCEYDGDATRLEQELEAMQPFLSDAKLRGIGEIGLDYHFSPYDKNAQIQVLEHMLQIAQDQKLPVSFHVREAFEDFWPIYDNFKLPPSVLHSFSDSEFNMQEGLRRGMYIGVNGLATFAKLPQTPIERILLETDSPYLTPQPFRGKINMPGYVYYVAEWIAQNYQLKLEEVAAITSRNAASVYAI